MCKKRDFNYWILGSCLLFFSFLNLFGRVRGRGGGFFDFLPLDIMRPACLLLLGEAFKSCFLATPPQTSQASEIFKTFMKG